LPSGAALLAAFSQSARVAGLNSGALLIGLVREFGEKRWEGLDQEKPLHAGGMQQTEKVRGSCGTSLAGFGDRECTLRAASVIMNFELRYIGENGVDRRMLRTVLPRDARVFLGFAHKCKIRPGSRLSPARRHPLPFRLHRPCP
jgi:hypothetical protein